MKNDWVAIMEAEEIGASDAYFEARHSSLDTGHNRHLFRAGFERGYKKADETCCTEFEPCDGVIYGENYKQCVKCGNRVLA